MRERKNEKIKESLKHLAAEFLSEKSNRVSMITVTRVEFSKKGDRAAILVTVFPEKSEAEALAFLERQGGKFRDFVATHLSIQRLPFFSFALDFGEKNRQKLDTLSS